MGIISMSSFKFKPLSFLVASLFAVSGSTYAENKAEVLELGTVEVVSTTPLQALGTPVSEVPANVQVATSKEIDQQNPLNLGEFLDNNLGSVNTSNGIGNPYQMDVSYRGFTASPVMGSAVGMSVYFDGVRFNEPFGDIVNWDLIPSNAISSINLIPGSNPLFGLNTLGGALAVNTKSGSTSPGVSATLTGGSWGRRAFQFEAGGEDKESGLDYFVAGNIFHEDGWRDHSSSDVRQIFSKVGWHNDKTDLDLSLALADNEMEGTQSLPLSMWGNTKQAYTYPDSIKNKLAMISLKGTHFLSDDKLVAGNVYYRMSNARSFNSNAQCNGAQDQGINGCPSASVNGTPTADVGLIDSQNLMSTTYQDGYGGSLQFSLLNDLIGHHNNFTVGASADWSRVSFNQDGYDAYLQNYQTITTDPSAPSTTQVRLKTRSDYYGLYATDNFAFNDQLNMTLSGRYNVAKVNLSGFSYDPALASLPTPLDPRGDLNGNHEYKRFNPAIGFNYNPTKSLGFYGGYNEGMRAPTPIELSCADEKRPCSLPAGFNSDPDLKMVVAKTWEGGVRGKLTEDLNWNIGLYDTRTENDIQFIASSFSQIQGYFQNVGQTERKGIEVGVHGRADKLTFAANYGFVDATYQTPFDLNSQANTSQDINGVIHVNKGNRIPGIARQTLKLRSTYEVTPEWNVGGNLLVAAGQYAHGDENNQDANGKVPGYAVMNLDTSYKLNANWILFAKVNNLFDKEYVTYGQLGQNIYTGQDEQFRTPAAPRAGWVGVTYQFGQAKQTASFDKD
jgi:outer membrane receptor protein involved in Fe transport